VTAGTDGAPSDVQQPAKQQAAAPSKVKPTEYIAFPDGFVRPTEYVAMPTIVQQHKPAPVTEPVAPAPAAAAAKAGSGLIQIETDLSKAASVAQAAPNSEGHAPRRRSRQREVYVENEPLVQIETQHTQG
jgi:hypothetical protein